MSTCQPDRSEGRTYCGEAERVDFHTQSGNVFLFELAGQMALHERCLPEK